VVVPLEGALPDDGYDRRIVHIPIDRATGTARLGWGCKYRCSRSLA
jgi:hypothetical protein